MTFPKWLSYVDTVQRYWFYEHPLICHCWLILWPENITDDLVFGLKNVLFLVCLHGCSKLFYGISTGHLENSSFLVHGSFECILTSTHASWCSMALTKKCFCFEGRQRNSFLGYIKMTKNNLFFHHLIYTVTVPRVALSLFVLTNFGNIRIAKVEFRKMDDLFSSWFSPSFFCCFILHFWNISCNMKKPIMLLKFSL